MKLQVHWGQMLKVMLNLPTNFLLIIPLLMIACEWKPPRRPVKTSLLKQDDSKQAKGAVNKSNTNESIQNLDSSPVVKSNTDSQTKSKTEQKTQLTNPPKPQVTELLSQEEQLLQRDYLLTIDPDGPPLIHLKEFTIAVSVVNRMPKDAQRLINRGQKQVFAYLRVRNFEKPQKIQIKWIHNEEIIQLDRLQVGISPRWRTWSSLRFNKVKKRLGEWRVEVSTGAGKLIGLTHFIRN